MKQKPNLQPCDEALDDCPLCGRGKFGARGLNLHHCPQMPKMHHRQT